jgi:hypothetical protein
VRNDFAVTPQLRKHMARPAHKDDTKTFSELTFSEQSKSITAAINNLQAAIRYHTRTAKDPAKTGAKCVVQKCVVQVERLLKRLRVKQT